MYCQISCAPATWRGASIRARAIPEVLCRSPTREITVFFTYLESLQLDGDAVGKFPPSTPGWLPSCPGSNRSCGIESTLNRSIVHKLNHCTGNKQQRVYRICILQIMFVFCFSSSLFSRSCSRRIFHINNHFLVRQMLFERKQANGFRDFNMPSSSPTSFSNPTVTIS